MADLDPALVEKAARSACDTLGRPPCSYPKCTCGTKNPASLAARAALLSLGIPAAALNALARGDAVVVPKEPTENQWGELARDIMMWLDMGNKHPRALFAHLEALGRDIPQWLRDEPELQNLDHTPSKGTRCAIIYRAMLAASPYRSDP